MTIEQYLAELARLVPRRRRRRFLEEAESHLHDAAAGHERRGLTRDTAEEAAVRDFGAPQVVARRFLVAGALCELRSATAIVAGGALLFVVPLYGIPENTLPPASWERKPTDILVLQVVTVALWGAAVVLGWVAAGLAWTSWPRLAANVATASAVAIGTSAAVSAVLVVRWFAYAPATPMWPLLASPAALACLGGCLVAAQWARSRARVFDAGIVR